MKKDLKQKKITLKKTTIAHLDTRDLEKVLGGGTLDCAQTVDPDETGLSACTCYTCGKPILW